MADFDENLLRSAINLMLETSSTTPEPSLDDVKEIYRLEYMIDQLKRAHQDFNRQGKTFGFHASKFLSHARTRLDGLLRKEIAALTPYFSDHWMSKEDIEAWEAKSHEGHDDYLEYNVKSYEILKDFLEDSLERGWLIRGQELVIQAHRDGKIELPIDEQGRIRASDIEAAAQKMRQWKPDILEDMAWQAAEHFVKAQSKHAQKLRFSPRVINQVMQRIGSDKTTSDRMVTFNMMLGAVHERGNLAEWIYGNIHNHPHAYETLGALSQEPDPAWDREVRTLLQREVLLRDTVRCLLEADDFERVKRGLPRYNGWFVSIKDRRYMSTRIDDEENALTREQVAQMGLDDIKRQFPDEDVSLEDLEVAKTMALRPPRDDLRKKRRVIIFAEDGAPLSELSEDEFRQQAKMTHLKFRMRGMEAPWFSKGVFGSPLQEVIDVMNEFWSKNSQYFDAALHAEILKR